MSDYSEAYNDLVTWFAKRMYDKLEANSHKRDSYNDVSAEWIWDKIHEELEEIDDALASDLPLDVIQECADLANAAMFLAHLMRQRADKGE
jgi:hypothetical protein